MPGNSTDEGSKKRCRDEDGEDDGDDELGDGSDEEEASVSSSSKKMKRTISLGGRGVFCMYL